MDLMPERKSECVVSEDIAATLLVVRLFGIAPLQITHICNGIYRVKKSQTILALSNILMICLSITTISLGVFFLLRDEIIRSHHSPIKIGFYIIIKIPSILFIIVLILRGKRRMEALVYVLYQIQKIRKNIGYACALKSKSWILTFFTLVLLLYNGMHLLDLLTSQNQEIFTSTAIHICHNIIFVTQLSYMFLNTTVRSATRALNQRLTEMTATEDKNLSLRHSYKNLLNLYDTYISIHRVVIEFMECEGLLTVLTLIKVTNRSFVNVYNLWTVFESIDVITNFKKRLLIEFFWLVNNTAKLLLLLEPFHRLDKEMSNTQNVISKLINSMPRNNLLYDKLDDFFQQFLMKQALLTPLGFCKFSRSLIFTIIGCSMSFLLIVNQFNISKLTI